MMLLKSLICIIFLALSEAQYSENIQWTYSRNITLQDTWFHYPKELYEKELEEFTKTLTSLSPVEIKNSDSTVTGNREINKVSNTEIKSTIPQGNNSNTTISSTTSTPKGNQILTNNLSNSKETNRSCTDENERFAIPGSCDTYIECRDGNAEKKQCPDGLRYNHNVKPDLEPCQYPVDVQCANGSTLQQPKPTENCPNQFGYFKTRDMYNCSSFRICENGIGYDYNCPNGLAFNKKTYRCEWPDRVSECNTEGYLEFKCPEVTNPAKINITTNYRSPKDCSKYFACTKGKPRQLECDKYFAYNQQKQACVPAFEIEECTKKQIDLSDAFVRIQSNGEYFILPEDDYLNKRFVSISFDGKAPKRNKVIS